MRKKMNCGKLYESALCVCAMDALPGALSMRSALVGSGFPAARLYAIATCRRVSAPPLEKMWKNRGPLEEAEESRVSTAGTTRDRRERSDERRKRCVGDVRMKRIRACGASLMYSARYLAALRWDAPIQKSMAMVADGCTGVPESSLGSRTYTSSPSLTKESRMAIVAFGVEVIFAVVVLRVSFYMHLELLDGTPVTGKKGTKDGRFPCIVWRDGKSVAISDGSLKRPQQAKKYISTEIVYEGLDAGRGIRDFVGVAVVSQRKMYAVCLE